VSVAPSLADDVGAWLVESGAGGVIEETAGRRAVLVTYGETPALEALAEKARNELGKRAKIELRPARKAVQGWETAWMEYLEPVRISPELELVPLPAGASPDTSRKDVVWLEPALAFGFGEHATTRMAAKVVSRLVQGGAKRVLDVGTGSGVLALAAVHAGATRAVGVDIDERAVSAARRNAALNGAEKRCHFSTATVMSLRVAFDVIVANIDRKSLLDLGRAMTKRLAAGGSLVVTGILDDDGRDIESHYRELGLTRALQSREGDFVLIAFRAR
jgi:ribosomal protein L11 methyltransferase